MTLELDPAMNTLPTMSAGPEPDGATRLAVHRNVAIPLRDGVCVSANLYLPDEPRPAPALMAYYPYRKDDYMGSFEDHTARCFARRGYACLLIDFRGIGASQGTPWDANDTPNESADGADIVTWIARAEWCDGNVGIWGHSYGAVAALQTAAARPPGLKAIVPLMGYSDPYDDKYYPGGCFSCMHLTTWAGLMLALQLMPPGEPEPDAAWYEAWIHRLHASEPNCLPWRKHAQRDDLWAQRAIDVSQIEAATFLIGGWHDLFPEPTVRIFQDLRSPRKLVMGPWEHTYPSFAPVEATDHLALMCRWWDTWLKDADTGILDEPAVAVYVRGSQQWRHAPEWPIPSTSDETLFLTADQSLQPEESSVAQRLPPYTVDPTVGVWSGLWEPSGSGAAQPLDQALDDARSLSFTSIPLSEALEITGSPVARLRVEVEGGADVNFVVKLCDVAPSGRSTLITTGWVKVSSDRFPDDAAEVVVQLWATSYCVPAGHKLRLNISGADFPRIWPTPTSPEIRVGAGGPDGSRLEIPVVREPRGTGPALPAPNPSENGAPLIRHFEPRRELKHDIVGDSVTVTSGSTYVADLPSGSGTISMEQTSKAVVQRTRPDGAYVLEQMTVTLKLPTGSAVQVATTTRQTAESVSAKGRVELDGQPIFERSWHA